MRVLLAKTPRSYRQVFTGARRALPPHAGVITIESDATEEEARIAGRAQVESALETHECPGGRGCGR